MATRKKSWNELVTGIRSTFRKWNVTMYVIEPLTPPARRDAYHTYEQRVVTVRFRFNNRNIELSSSSELIAHDNLAQLALTIEQLYLNRVRSIEGLIIAAYRQLLPPMMTPEPPKIDEGDPYRILGVERHYPLAVIELIWKARLRVEHPDAGGSAAVATKLNAAMADIRKRRAA